MCIGLALAKTSSVILANLVIENVVPEFMQADATPEKLAPASRDALDDTPQRRRQLDAFWRLDAHYGHRRQAAEGPRQLADIALVMLREARKSG